jgi:hypothetical protein
MDSIYRWGRQLQVDSITFYSYSQHITTTIHLSHVSCKKTFLQKHIKLEQYPYPISLYCLVSKMSIMA